MNRASSRWNASGSSRPALALRIAGARLAALPGLSCVDLARRLRHEPSRLDELAVLDLTIRGRLDSSYRHLDSVAAKAFRRLARLETPAFTWSACRQLPGLSAPEAEAATQRLLGGRCQGPSPLGEPRTIAPCRLR